MLARAAKISPGITCVAEADESSEATEAEPPRIKLPSCDAAAATEMVRKDRTSFMVVGNILLSMVCMLRGQICCCNERFGRFMARFGVHC